MKKNIIFIFILIIFFVMGILIYDFSDKMDDILLNNKWYLYENDITYIMDFNENKFSYTLEDGSKLNKYNKCTTFAFNKSTNIVRLNCDIENNKLYIAKYDENNLTITIDGTEKHFFANKNLALINNFKNNNNLTDEEYEKLLSIKFDNEKYINITDFKKLIKNKNTSYLALIRNNLDYENVLNYKALEKIIKDNFYLINIDTLDEKNLNILNTKTKLNTYDKNIIYVFELGNKKISLKKEITINNINEIKSFKI